MEKSDGPLFIHQLVKPSATDVERRVTNVSEILALEHNGLALHPFIKGSIADVPVEGRKGLSLEGLFCKGRIKVRFVSLD